MKRRDFVLLLAILVLAGALLIAGNFRNNGSAPGRKVEVYLNGVLYATATLGIDDEIRVEQPNGALNIIQLEEEGFFMAYSSCPNQLCIAQGKVTEENFRDRALGNHILCLPNRVDVVLKLTDRDDAEAMTDG